MVYEALLAVGLTETARLEQLELDELMAFSSKLKELSE
jgi:hypothetical protein